MNKYIRLYNLYKVKHESKSEYKNNDEKMLISRCCNSSNLIEPDLEAAEEAGSLWQAYACYICKDCGKACQVDKKTK